MLSFQIYLKGLSRFSKGLPKMDSPLSPSPEPVSVAMLRNVLILPEFDVQEDVWV